MTKWIMLLYNHSKGDDFFMATVRQNISIDEEVLEDFCKYAGRNGIKISTWVTAKMREFIEEETILEEHRKNRNK